MTDQTSRFELPLMMPAQAQKHIVHNEALLRLEGLLHIKVETVDADGLPEVAANGTAVALSETPHPDFAHRSGQLAVRADNSWTWYQPMEGWRVWSCSQKQTLIHDGAGWIEEATLPDSIPTLGINTSATGEQRLSVSSEATRLDHDGSGHRVFINRATPDDTASLIFQTANAGEAEIGLTATDGMTLKTASDGGQTWTRRMAFPSDHSGVQSQLFRSQRFSLDPETTIYIPTPWDGGIVAVAETGETFPQSHHSGLFVYDTGTSLALTTLVACSGLENLDDTALTGTAASENRTGIGVRSGEIGLENRTRGIRHYSLVFLG